jgi:hypothetical protein
MGRIIGLYVSYTLVFFICCVLIFGVINHFAGERVRKVKSEVTANEQELKRLKDQYDKAAAAGDKHKRDALYERVASTYSIMIGTSMYLAGETDNDNRFEDVYRLLQYDLEQQQFMATYSPWRLKPK